MEKMGSINGWHTSTLSSFRTSEQLDFGVTLAGAASEALLARGRTWPASAVERT